MKQKRAPPVSLGVMPGDFQALVGEHQDRVYSLACYLLGDREEAADVTQEVLLKLWRNMGELDESAGGNVAAWLLRVTRNRCFDLMRKLRTQRSALGQAEEPEAVERAPAAGADPERLAASTDLGRHLRRAVQELSEPYRSVIILREVQEMKYREISETLEMPINTVKVNIHRGRRMLRERLKEVMGHALAY
ncbi:MAG TPA: sigma-70 family RNA polymerase sigma factor [Thermoanaerobaculia bacterium]|nr:sigma-70 family RNA polymerase sigma factor [Thermoanaerobaculia bacterium]